jgi:hypothetical protein
METIAFWMAAAGPCPQTTSEYQSALHGGLPLGSLFASKR